MNTPADYANDHLRYAEYVLGVLDADARAAVAHEVETSDEAAVAVALWQQRLLPLAEAIADVEPADYVWARIRGALQLASPERVSRPQRRGLWNSLPFWHWVGVGSSVVAAVLLVVLATHRAPTPAAAHAHAGYMASTIQQTNGATGWTATMDLAHGRMVVVPATPQKFVSGRAPELWLIPPDGKPIAVGMIALNQPTTIRLDATMLAKLGPSAALAVSVEPVGGSPTGQPTGAVIAKGAISGAPDGGKLGSKVASVVHLTLDAESA